MKIIDYYFDETLKNEFATREIREFISQDQELMECMEQFMGHKKLDSILTNDLNLTWTRKSDGHGYVKYFRRN